MGGHRAAHDATADDGDRDYGGQRRQRAAPDAGVRLSVQRAHPERMTTAHPRPTRLSMTSGAAARPPGAPVTVDEDELIDAG